MTHDWLEAMATKQKVVFATAQNFEPLQNVELKDIDENTVYKNSY